MAASDYQRERARRQAGYRTLKERAMREGGERCEACGWAPREALARATATRQPSYLHLHHIRPLHGGGQDTAENVALLCGTCHAVAHALWPARWPHLWRLALPADRGEALALIGDYAKTGGEPRRWLESSSLSLPPL